jgi:hypothetical protein
VFVEKQQEHLFNSELDLNPVQFCSVPVLHPGSGFDFDLMK